MGVLAALVAAPAAHASHTQESVFQDDHLLQNANPFVQMAAFSQLSSFGVDAIHTVVNWRRIAPDPNAHTPPAGFDGSNPASYGSAVWDPYDNLVRFAHAHGISVIMSPAGPLPNWGSRCPQNINLVCKPNATLYGQFVTALARRYSGSYVDEDQDQQALPRVGRWTVWNEPNLSAWLYPQSRRGPHHTRIPVGAAQYRGLVYAAAGALRATGHAHDPLLVGETAPIGGGPTRTTPVDFLLQLFCLDPKGHRMHGKLARAEGCVHAPPIPAAGLSHHPYARGAGIPTYPRQRRGSLTLGAIGRFVPLLRELRHSRIAPHRRLGVYFTEFGITTRPPDRRFGVSLEHQAQLINEADYLAYLRPWVKSVSQFQLEDDPNLGPKETFETGLMFTDGRPKPSLTAYRIPIFVVTHGKRLVVFGQVRPDRFGPRQRVEIQFAPRHHGFRTIATRLANARGYIYVRLKARRGSWRLRWVDSHGVVSYSRVSGAVPPSSHATPGVPPPGPGPVPPPPAPGPGPGTPPPAPPGPPPPPPSYTLAVSVQNGVIGSGSVTSDPAGIDCGSTCSADFTAGTLVTLTATPANAASFFQGWTGCDSTSGNTCRVTMGSARSVTAQFGP